MPKTLLTDISIRSLKADTRTDFWDAKTAGFGVRVGKNSKTFVVKRGNRRLTIGRYGDWTLQKAREEAKRLLLQKASGNRITLSKALDLFVEHMERRNRPSTKREQERILRKHLAPTFERRIEDISKSEILALLRLIKQPSAANHCFTVCRLFFRWAARNDYIEHSPLTNLTVPNKTSSRSRVLTDSELKSIYQTVSRKTTPFNSIVALLLLTGQRRGEIAALQSSWITNDTLTFPAAITKNGREHLIPLTAFSKSILTPLVTSGITFLFPARGSKSKPFNGWSKSKAALDKASGVYDWTLHDLRRTFVTRLAELGVAPHIIERLINHATGTISGVAAIYNRATYGPECRSACLLWEEHLANLLRGE